ncbi:sulfatase-like hydrolase/transferase [Anaeromicrobium sediminis]|uniref:Arylsulfatase n=1 Tax=Anaeromicrobium sediminis TaxID=1478221 RepID=A0A267MB09_9FIRM|nr:sulfatase-like hydrolase/transferase [Anaeromicrobium sediminis]PAB56637.1 arylsulfatase [Anaeromicrobium sediminis]
MNNYEYEDNTDATDCNSINKPNFLIITVDEDRFPPVYETDAIKAWRKTFLRAQEMLKDNGLEFNNHYAGSTACSPSRTTLYTGQYPSLHGVSQTTGAAKVDFEPGMFWLDPNTVPTMGDYFRTAGYRTFWKGKWHASQADILIPDTQDSYISYNPDTGVPVPMNERIYLNANRLNEFGFDDWIGPEPFGGNPRNSGSSAAIGLSGRDIVYAQEVVNLINQLDEERQNSNNFDSQPWVIMCSFVNPHDIALFGAFTRISPLFNFEIDPSVPEIPRAPTADELLLTKPQAQRSYREVYPKALQPLEDTLFYRQLYYTLQLKVDRDMQKVIRAIKNSSFYKNTIVIFTSDHGEMLGAHGGLFQKWYQAYEETVHVPFIVHNPVLFKGRESTNILTSHVDILPTMLGLAGIDVAVIQRALSNNHTEVHPLVGKDLSPFIIGKVEDQFLDEPVYFMTDDNFTKGIDQTTLLGVPYTSVIQPNSIETVITALPTGEDNEKEIWKYSRYFDNPQFWSNPGCEDKVVTKSGSTPVSPGVTCSTCITTIKTRPVPDEIEFYNLTKDPLESRNLADPEFSTPETRVVELVLAKALEEQCQQKRIYPSSGNVPGKPSCRTCTPDYKV